MNASAKMIAFFVAAAFQLPLAAVPVYVDGKLGNDETGDGSESAPFKTLQRGAALIAADTSREGLYLAPATYVLTNDFVFGRITNANSWPWLRGLGTSPADVVIDGQGQYSWGRQSYVRGMSSITFSNLYSQAAYAFRLAGAGNTTFAELDVDTEIILSNCVITCSRAEAKNVVHMSGAERMVDCVITNCASKGDLVYANGGCQIERCKILGNVCRGGSIVALSTIQYAKLDKYGLSHVFQTDFVGNRATTSLIDMMPTVSNCTFAANWAGGSTCRYPSNFKSGAPLTLVDSSFVDNVSTNGGTQSGCAGVSVDNAMITNSLIANCVIRNCSAPNSANNWNAGGGALRLKPTSVWGSGLVVRNVSITGCDAGTSEGSAVFCTYDASTAGDGPVVFENCTIADNGVDYPGNKKRSAVYFDKTNNGRTYFKNCVFSNGTAGDPRVHGIKGVSGWQSDQEYANMSNCLFASEIDYAFKPAQKIKNGQDPLFEANSYVPSRNSPLVDAGLNNASWMTTAYDLQRDEDGKPFCKRIVNGVVDIGAYEYRPIPGFLLLLR